MLLIGFSDHLGGGREQVREERKGEGASEEGGGSKRDRRSSGNKSLQPKVIILLDLSKGVN